MSQYMAVFYLVFGILLGRGTPDFVIYLLTGLIPWLWFEKSVSNSTGSILGGAPIIMQTKVPLVLFPSEVVLQDGVKQLPVFLMLLAFLLLVGKTADIQWIGLVPVFLVQFLFTLAMALLVAAVVPFLPDLRYLVKTGLMMMMFVSGIFYSYDLILPEHQPYFFMNPMALLIKAYRDVLLEGSWPHWSGLFLVAFFSLLVIVLVGWMYRSMSPVYARVILEN